MKREEADQLYKDVKDSMPPHIIFRSLLEFIIDKTAHHQDHSKEKRLEEAINALWGKGKIKKDAPKENQIYST